MKMIKLISIFSASVLIFSHAPLYSRYIIVNNTVVESYSDVSNVVYESYSSNKTFNNFQNNSLSLKEKFIFVNEDAEFYRQRYIYTTGLGLFGKFSKDQQRLFVYSDKVRSELFWLSLERAKFVRHMDVIDRSMLRDELLNNYDYVITMRSFFNGKMDKKSADSRRTEYFVKSIRTGVEVKIAETTGSPLISEQLGLIAGKLSNFVSMSNEKAV